MDEFGFDPVFTQRVKGTALSFCKHYWRVEVDGVTNVPARGRALLVANHAAFGRPIEVSQFGPDAADHECLVLELGEEVRGWIQEAIHRLLARRRTIFF